MDRDFYDNDFEAFLKQKSDQYKMYPSDRVWNNVYSSLHGRKKWWAIGFTLLFIGTGLLVGKEATVSGFNKIAREVNKAPEISDAASLAENKPITQAKVIPIRNHVSSNSSNNVRAEAPVIALETRAIKNPIPGKAGNSFDENTGDNFTPGVNMVSGIEQSQVIENNLLPSIPSIINNSVASISVPQKNRFFKNAPATAKLPEQLNSTVDPLAKKTREALTHSRWSLQVYASPTISYRRLSNFNKQANTYTPIATGYAGDINRFVRHKPAPGFEVGTNVQYKLSDNLTVFGGAQLNYSRYYIDAYKYRTEKASIALNNTAVRNDTVSGYTDIRNFSGYAPEQLQNKYLQLSLPVGIEIKLLGRKKLQFSVAGGIQPTFLLTSTSYLISSDYKNYIQSPDLARGFNVHTNFEAFISYKTGGLKWQIGPQFRSQLLSSYSNQYRVREYLTEYGIKFGVTRNF